MSSSCAAENSRSPFRESCHVPLGPITYARTLTNLQSNVQGRKGVYVGAHILT